MVSMEPHNFELGFSFDRPLDENFLCPNNIDDFVYGKSDFEPPRKKLKLRLNGRTVTAIPNQEKTDKRDFLMNEIRLRALNPEVVSAMSIERKNTMFTVISLLQKLFPDETKLQRDLARLRETFDSCTSLILNQGIEFAREGLSAELDRAKNILPFVPHVVKGCSVDEYGRTLFNCDMKGSLILKSMELNIWKEQDYQQLKKDIVTCKKYGIPLSDIQKENIKPLIAILLEAKEHYAEIEAAIEFQHLDTLKQLRSYHIPFSLVVETEEGSALDVERLIFLEENATGMEDVLKRQPDEVLTDIFESLILTYFKGQDEILEIENFQKIISEIDKTPLEQLTPNQKAHRNELKECIVQECNELEKDSWPSWEILEFLNKNQGTIEQLPGQSPYLEFRQAVSNCIIKLDIEDRATAEQAGLTYDYQNGISRIFQICMRIAKPNDVILGNFPLRMPDFVDLTQIDASDEKMIDESLEMYTAALTLAKEKLPYIPKGDVIALPNVLTPSGKPTIEVANTEDYFKMCQLYSSHIKLLFSTLKSFEYDSNKIDDDLALFQEAIA